MISVTGEGMGNARLCVCVCVRGVGVPFAVLNTLPEEASLRGGPVGQGRKLAMRFSGGKASGRRTG